MVSSFCDVVAYSDMRKRTFPTRREYPPKLWSKTPALRLEEIRMQAVENMVNIIRIYVLKVTTTE
jgi:predicted secreted protein